MLSLINWRVKVTLSDGRNLTGQMLAFDKHMNLVLADCEEFRRHRAKKKAGESGPAAETEIKRTLGLVILRGEMVVSLSVEGPPPVDTDDKKGPGVSYDNSMRLNVPLLSVVLLIDTIFVRNIFRFSLAQVVECLLGVAWA